MIIDDGKVRWGEVARSNGGGLCIVMMERRRRMANCWNISQRHNLTVHINPCRIKEVRYVISHGKSCFIEIWIYLKCWQGNWLDNLLSEIVNSSVVRKNWMEKYSKLPTQCQENHLFSCLLLNNTFLANFSLHFVAPHIFKRIQSFAKFQTLLVEIS